MSAIANHMRITGMQVTNEDVDTRKKAVADVIGIWSKIKDSEAIIVKAAEIADALGGAGVPPAALGAEIEGVVQQHASAFLQSERPLEIGIVAGVAAMELMSATSRAEGWMVADILATALWSALAFQPATPDAKRELLRTSVLRASLTRSSEAAEGTITRLGQLVGRLRTLIEGVMPRLLVVITHRDVVESTTVVRERITSELAKHGVSAEIVQVAPFSESDKIPAGFGLDDLINATVGRQISALRVRLRWDELLVKLENSPSAALGLTADSKDIMLRAVAAPADFLSRANNGSYCRGSICPFLKE